MPRINKCLKYSVYIAKCANVATFFIIIAERGVEAEEIIGIWNSF